MNARSQVVENFQMAEARQKIKDLKCPYCGKKVQHKYRPFCSRRCAQLDLGHWLNEDYRVPVVEYDDIDENKKDDL